LGIIYTKERIPVFGFISPLSKVIRMRSLACPASPGPCLQAGPLAAGCFAELPPASSVGRCLAPGTRVARASSAARLPLRLGLDKEGKFVPFWPVKGGVSEKWQCWITRLQDSKVLQENDT